MSDDELVSTARAPAGARVARSSCTPTRWSTWRRTAGSAGGCASRTWTRARRIGQTAAELERYFEALPDARLLLRRRARQGRRPVDGRRARAAVAVLGAAAATCTSARSTPTATTCRSRTPTRRRFAAVLSRCSDVPWILEAPPILRRAVRRGRCALSEAAGVDFPTPSRGHASSPRSAAPPCADALARRRVARRARRPCVFGSWARGELTDGVRRRLGGAGRAAVRAL